MFYTYIIKSKKDQSFYIGHTSNLIKRFESHNKGLSKYSSKKSPFEMIWYGAFKTKAKAQKFEKYLKSSSGCAFRNKRLV